MFPASHNTPLPYVPPHMLVDGVDYDDTGCELAPRCLACPFDACKYDDPDVLKLDAARRDREIARLRRDHHVPIEALMRAYSLSRAHVYRALREHGVTRPWVGRNGQSKTLRYHTENSRSRKKANSKTASGAKRGRPNDGHGEKGAVASQSVGRSDNRDGEP